MTRQSVSCIMVVPALLLAVAVAVSDAQQKGRYKKQGANCEWDANDAGADQCRPASGRWKKDGDACTWAASDSAPISAIRARRGRSSCHDSGVVGPGLRSRPSWPRFPGGGWTAPCNSRGVHLPRTVDRDPIRAAR